MSKPPVSDDDLPNLNFNIEDFLDEEDEVVDDAKINEALRNFANSGPEHGITSNPRAPRKIERQMHEPDVLRPEILDELDLGGYDIIPIWQNGASERFLGLFLPAVKKDFDETGVGTWDCILQFRAVNQYDEHRLRRFKATLAQMLSRLRLEVNRGPDWRFVMLRYEVLPDRRHVATSWARMTDKHYNAWLSERARERYKERSTLATLKDYL